VAAAFCLVTDQNLANLIQTALKAQGHDHPHRQCALLLGRGVSKRSAQSGLAHRAEAQCAEAGYTGIELGPVGFMPEDPAVLAEALDEYGLELIGGVVFRAFHDADQWDDVMDGAVRTCKALKAHGAQHLVLIDSISPRRAPTAGRADEAEQMDPAEWAAYRDRIATVAKMGAEEYGLTVGIHAHAAGFMDFEPELERLLDEVDDKILKICFDTGHHSYAGFDPVSLHEAPYRAHLLHAFQGHRPGK
jgi:sugar phosphate isomerase/epimerase